MPTGGGHGSTMHARPVDWKPPKVRWLWWLRWPLGEWRTQQAPYLQCHEEEEEEEEEDQKNV